MLPPPPLDPLAEYRRLGSLRARWEARRGMSKLEAPIPRSRLSLRRTGSRVRFAQGSPKNKHNQRRPHTPRIRTALRFEIMETNAYFSVKPPPAKHGPGREWATRRYPWIVAGMFFLQRCRVQNENYAHSRPRVCVIMRGSEDDINVTFGGAPVRRGHTKPGPMVCTSRGLRPEVNQSTARG
jgi:hypothetical protein